MLAIQLSVSQTLLLLAVSLLAPIYYYSAFHSKKRRGFGWAWEQLKYFLRLKPGLERVRQLIDGEDNHAGNRFSPGTQAEIKLLDDVKKKLLDELNDKCLPLPNGTVVFPRKFLVFISPVDSRRWFGSRRKAVITAWQEVVQASAGKLTRKRLQDGALSAEVRVDGTLEAGKFWTMWLESEATTETATTTKQEKTDAGAIRAVGGER